MSKFYLSRFQQFFYGLAQQIHRKGVPTSFQEIKTRVVVFSSQAQPIFRGDLHKPYYITWYQQLLQERLERVSLLPKNKARRAGGRPLLGEKEKHSLVYVRYLER
jgi:hypothetical protein